MEKILVSACLLGADCKYSGGNNLCQAVVDLNERYDIIPICPEQMGGLPTPRLPAERQGKRVVTRNGEDVTAQYQKGAEAALYLAKLFSCEKAVLKARSPSCGCDEIYDGSFSGTIIAGDGVTTQLLKEHGIAVFNEETIESGLP